MHSHDVAALKDVARVLPEGATRSQILNGVADTISVLRKADFKALYDVEGMTEADLRAAPVAGTVMELVATAAQLSGRTVADATVGSVMDALIITKDDVNLLACFCHNDHRLSGEQAAKNLRALAGKA